MNKDKALESVNEIKELMEKSSKFISIDVYKRQGLNGIKALCDHLIFKKDVTCINYMPIDLLTVETIDYYHSK